MNRRTFLVALAAAGAALRPARAAGRIHVLVIPGDIADVRSGFMIGNGEVARMAKLLGYEWVAEDSRDQSPSNSPQAEAALLLGVDPAAMELAAAFARPMVAAVALPPNSPANIVSVRASSAASERALRFWNARHEGSRGAAAVEWHGDLEKFGAGEVNARFTAQHPAPVSPDLWAGWMAAKVAGDALVRDRDHPLTVAKLLASSFDGHKGVPLRFDADDRHLIQPLQIVAADGALLGTVDPGEVSS